MYKKKKKGQEKAKLRPTFYLPTGEKEVPGDCTMEFRFHEDDAWYNVSVVGEGEKLRVKFENFPNDDKLYDAASFKCSEELEDFRTRFRCVSLQVQDRDCREVSIGKHLCVSHALTTFDLRFYDATVEEVRRNDHTFTNGEEECTCEFLVCWHHGPNAGGLVEKKIESICIVQASAKLEPSLMSFMEMAQRKLEILSEKTDSSSIENFLELNTSRVIEKQITCLQEEELSPKWSFAKTCAFGDTEITLFGRHDVDMGEVTNPRAIFIQNIEKDLSSLAIMEFVHEKTSIASEACVFPSLSWETSTRGVIILESKSDLKKLVRFLQDPSHMIVSPTGRPWVVTEIMSVKDAGSLLLKPPARKSANHIGDELKVVAAGTMEYEKAKAQRDLFMEFVRHQERLHKRLDELTREESSGCRR